MRLRRHSRRRIAFALATTALFFSAALGRRIRSREVLRANTGTIVHLFEWRWQDIARECEAFLGPNGFAAVQVSPPQEHPIVPGNPWWSRYQVVSYAIAGRSGDRQAFQAMVARCQKAGVEIYVDAVINHTTGVGSGTGYLGSSFGPYDYPAIPYSYDDFHHCGRHGDDDIRNYQDRYEVQTCELVRLADLDTGSEVVRDRLAAYLNDLLGLGVAGFRIDAAKHMSAADVAAILSRLDRPAVIYQEVIEQPHEPIKASEYIANGRVTDFQYGLRVSAAFFEGRLGDLQAIGTTSGWFHPDRAVVFIDNHDNQRGHGGGGNLLSYKDGKLHELANIFMLAHPYGRPRLMSSFAFDDSDRGPPTALDGTTRPVWNEETVDCFGRHWQCEHRRSAIASMVAFRRQVGGAPLVHWWDDGRSGLAFGRGNLGFVAINRAADRALSRTLQTSLPPGNYCNIARYEFDRATHTCSGPTQRVDGRGQLALRVEPLGAAAFHVGALAR